jgi:curli biogenesis system outer membrane secretion channel CsgG
VRCRRSVFGIKDSGKKTKQIRKEKNKMKRIRVLIAAFVIIASSAMAQSDKMIVSIGNFKNKTAASDEVFSTLIDRMTNAIVNTRKFKVVDNARLKEAIDEQKKVDMGLSEAENAPEVGKIKCAGFSLYGTVLTLGAKADVIQREELVGSKITAQVELNVRFMDIETGELVASKIVKAKKSGSQMQSNNYISRGNNADVVLQDAIEQAVQQVADKLMELAFPTKIIKVTSSRVYVNLPEERCDVGMLLKVFSVGEVLIDPDTGEALGDAEELIGEVRIIAAKPKYAVAVPVDSLSVDEMESGMIVRPVSKLEMEERKDEMQDQAATRLRSRF